MTDGRNDLGSTLRAWRDRLSPNAAGLPSGGSRRARGLRREEVAALADISVDYITRLEQGRSKTPSAQVVAALARALQLTTQERDHLYRRAGLPAPQHGQISSHVPAGLQRLISRLGEIPLAVFTADLFLVTWTPLWVALMGDPRALPADKRNLVDATFFADSIGDRGLSPVRSENGQDATEAAIVADLRTASGLYPNDRRLHDLINRSIDTSQRFADLWASGAAGSHTSDRKTVTHPLVGDLTLDCDILIVPAADLKVVMYTAVPDTPDAEKLEFIRVMGAHAAPPPAPAPAPAPETT